MATYYPPEIMLLQGCPFQSSTRITWQVPNKGKGPGICRDCLQRAQELPHVLWANTSLQCFKAAEKLSHAGLGLVTHMSV